jgi:para-nitrobenzyl esterase
MPSAAGLFGRAIAQSVPGPFLSPGLATRITAAIAAEAGIAAALDAFQATAPQALAAASDAVRPREHPEWGLVSYGDVPFAPVVDGEVLPSTPWQAVAAGAARDVDLLTGHNRDEYRLFLEFGGLRGTISDEQATRELDALLEDGDRLYRLAYPEATAEQLYELVNSDWLFRIPTLHLAQAHAAAGGRTYLYELLYDATPLGACHALDVPLVFGAYKELGEFLLGNPPPDAAVQLGNLMRAEWVEFARTGDPGWSPYSIGRRLTRIYNENPDVVPYPEHASMHLWDQRRLGILDVAEGVSSGADLRTGRV